jgi:hypothetical protein
MGFFRLDAEPEISLVAVNGVVPEQHRHLVNWAELQIEEWLYDEGEGRMELIDEDKVYYLLGLRTEDDDGQSVANSTSNNDAVPDVGQATTNSTVPDVGSSGAAIPNIDTRGAAIPVDDAIPEETMMLHDPNNPCMDIGTVYPSMVEFRLAVRQYAINKQFGLRTAKTDTKRFTGKCMGEVCLWHIHARKVKNSKSVRV